MGAGPQNAESPTSHETESLEGPQRRDAEARDMTRAQMRRWLRDSQSHHHDWAFVVRWRTDGLPTVLFSEAARLVNDDRAVEALVAEATARQGVWFESRAWEPGERSR